jgi:hypothetical protein
MAVSSLFSETYLGSTIPEYLLFFPCCFSAASSGGR